MPGEPPLNKLQGNAIQDNNNVINVCGVARIYKISLSVLMRPYDRQMPQQIYMIVTETLTETYIEYELNCALMTSSNVNIFRVTGHLREEFTGDRWIPGTKAVTRHVDVFFDLRLRLVIWDAIAINMTPL